jgi:hypothetical protein
MGEFARYLSESIKEYDYKIKVAGSLDKDFANRLETACQKFEVKKLSVGKKTPIQEMPLDFPLMKNVEVTIYELKTAYPVSAHELREYLSYYLNLPKNQLVVRKPGEPSEEYQDEIKNKPSEFKSKLQDIEYKDAPKLEKDKMFGDKANSSLLKELLKDKKSKFEIEKGSDNKTQEIQSREEKESTSPIKAAHKGPVKGNPDPIKTAGVK